MKKLLKLILRYRLYMPLAFLRLIYMNMMRIDRTHQRCIFLPSRHAVLDIAKSAKVKLDHSVIFGWCNMKYSRMETALCMAEGSSLNWGGVDSDAVELVGYGSYIQIGRNASLSIGNSFINREVKIICNKQITIGNGCVIAMGVVIRDNDGGQHQIIDENYTNQKPITISDNVWIGENSMVLKGVTIGEGSVIAASSLVTKDVPPHCIAAGSPAKVIKKDISWKA